MPNMPMVTSIDGGSSAYWSDRKTAFALIRKAERAADRAAKAPLYLHGGYDADGDVIPVENFGPLEDLDDAIRAVTKSETAMSILAAQNRPMPGCYVPNCCNWPMEAVGPSTVKFADEFECSACGRLVSVRCGS